MSTLPPSFSSSDDLRQRLGEQISRLHQRQLSMIQETTQELEALRRELDASLDLDRQPLLAEIEALRSQVSTKDSELHSLQQRQANHQEEMQAVLDSLKGTVNGQLRTVHQQLRMLSLESLQGIEAMLDAVEAAKLPEALVPVVAQAVVPPAILPPVTVKVPVAFINPLPPVAPPVVAPTLPVASKPKEVLPLVQIKKPRGIKRFVRRSLSFAVIVGLAYAGWHTFAPAKPNESGTVAGVSTDASIVKTASTPIASTADAAQPEYKESKATVTFANTTWDHFDDPDFGVAMDYPNNATNLVHAVGGENMFFLRDDSYMLKISRSETDVSSLDLWMRNATSDYGDDYTIANGTFNNKPAYIATPKVHGEYSGTIYFVGRAGKNGNPTTIYQVWAKDEPANSDDAKRQDRMLSSIQFTL